MDEPLDRKHLFALFAARHDGTLTPAQHIELENFLQQSPAARRLWFLSCDVEVGLAEWAAGEHARRSLPPVPVLRTASPSQPLPLRRIVIILLLALGLACAGLLALQLLRSAKSPDLDPPPIGDAVHNEPPALAIPETESNRPRIDDGSPSTPSLSDDPATLVHYLFGTPAEPVTRLVNSAPRTGTAADGEILGPAWTDGRWPGKRALHFTSPAHGVAMNLPDFLSEVTFGAWIKIDALPSDLHLLCGSTVPEVGSLRWEITREGRLRLAVAVRRRGDQLLWEADNSPPLLAPTRGQWVFVVSTLAQKRLNHYVNGRLVRSHPVYCPGPFQLGASHIGTLPDVSGRAFAGAIDELFVLNRTLTDEEVGDLHRLGRP